MKPRKAQAALLPRISVTRPVTVTMCLFALLVLGAVAYSRIRVQAFASGFEQRSLSVRVSYPYTSPRETDQQIRIPLEELLRTVRDVNSIRTWSSGSGARARLDFQQDADMDLAYNQVSDRLERLKLLLPEEARDRVRVYRYHEESDDEILWIGITVPAHIRDIRAYIETHVGRPLERIKGVAKVNVWGAYSKEVMIRVDQDRLASRGLSSYDLIRSLQGENFALAGGYVWEGGKKLYVRSVARFQSLEEIKNTVIKNRNSGVRLREVADVVHDVPERGRGERLDGETAVSIGIFRESNANIVSISKQVANSLKAIGEETGIRFNVFFDQGKLIQESMHNLRNAAFWGGLFAALVLLFFLRAFRMTTLITFSIPLCVMMTIMALYFLGWTLNVLTMMGLMVGVGMVVDNAIVVVENIYRLRTGGASLQDASIQGASEVGLAITMATLTTVVVFLPLMLISGDVDITFYLSRIGLPVVVALLASLLVALLFIPLAAHRLGGTRVKSYPKEVHQARNSYCQTLKWALHRRRDISLLVLLVLATIVVPMDGVRTTDSLKTGLNDLRLRVYTPPFFSWEDVRDLGVELEDFLDDRRGVYGIRTVRLNYSQNGLRIHAFLEDDPNTEWWYEIFQNTCRFVGFPTQDRMDREDIIQDMRTHMPRFVGVRTSIDSKRGKWNPNLSVFLYGEDVEVLASLSEEVERRLRAVPSVVSVDSELERAGNEIQVLVNREQVRKLGMSSREVGRAIGYQLRGARLPRYQADEREIAVRLWIREEDRETLNQLKNLTFETEAEEEVALSTFAEFKVSKGRGTIYRKDGKTQLRIRAFSTRKDRRVLYANVDRAMDGFSLPRGYSWDKGERFARLKASDQALYLAIGLSVVFVFLLMGILFESFILPFSVLLSIPFALLGVYWTLYLTETTLNGMAQVGAILLVGVVVNNAIVLVDRINRLRLDGWDRDGAVVEAGFNRFRPILMTTFTTVFGLLPMAVGGSTLLGVSYVPLGRTMMGGLIFSTFLTLYIVPIFYTFLDDLGDAVRRMIGAAWDSGR